MGRESSVSAAERRVRWRERLFGLARPFLPEGSSSWHAGALILLYHRVVAVAPSRDPFAVAAEAFDRQVRWLTEHYTVITVRELVARARQGNAGAFAAITFDDGYDCTVSRALPVLRAHGVRATVFVDTGRLNTDRSALTDTDVRTLADAGIEIGSHSVTHPNLLEVDDGALAREVSESRARLEQLLGQRVDGFAHPFGRYDDRVREAVKRAGYAYACTCRQHQTNPQTADPYELTRLEINASDDHERFVSKVRGRYAPLYFAWYRLNPATRPWVRSFR